MFKQIPLAIILFSFFIMESAYALPFTISAQGTLPTTVPIGGQVSAAYTVTNNTNTVRSNTFVKYLPPNTSVSSIGCGPTFTLTPNSSCTLNLTITGPINGNDPNPHNHLFICFPGGTSCTGTADSLNVTQSNSSQTRSYIANASADSISICFVDSSGNLNNCTDATDSSFNNPTDVILNANSTLAYVINGSSGAVSICRIMANGGLGTCQVTDPIIAGGGNNPGLQIVNNFLYITDYFANLVYICPIKSNGLLNTCSANTGNGTYAGPTGRIAFNRSGTLAYVPNYWSTSVSICQVQANGNLTACVVSADAAIFRALGATMNPLGNFLYIANGGNDNRVVVCAVNSNGTLGSCQAMSDPSFALGDYQNNMFISSSQRAYIPNPNGALSGTTLSICPILDNGLFDTCTTTNADNTLGGPTGIWLTNAS